MKRATPRASLVPLLLAALMILGCGQGQAPTDSPEVTATYGPDGYVYITFSSSLEEHAAKVTAIGPDGLHTSDVFTAAGNQIAVSEPNEEGASDDLDVTFTVDEDALSQDVTIDMTVHGNTLSDVVVVFGPCGLTFAILAELRIELGMDLVDYDVDALIAWHVHGDGSSEQAGMRISQETDKVIIEIDVPGFSRYSLGDGDF